MLHITEKNGGVIFAVRVLPRSSRSEIAGLHGGALKVRITAAPVEGKANEACVACIADFLGVPKSRVEIIAGSTAKNKRLFVAGMTRTQVESRINDL
ncbi:MAG TPA: DUF167 domain-containing protein [Deltaproteobacteria bacterium]|nr:DUF167 domain-containing protein [Deltaproteobacteria bacterium]